MKPTSVKELDRRFRWRWGHLFSRLWPFEGLQARSGIATD